MMHQMTRWVEVNGCRVRFGNIVGGFVGRDYSYHCASEADAVAFGSFLKERDPKHPNLPCAVTDADRMRFNATEAQP